jgi:hypothetical protein
MELCWKAQTPNLLSDIPDLLTMAESRRAKSGLPAPTAMQKDEIGFIKL